MLINRINIDNKNDFVEIAEKLNRLDSHPIAHQNWTEYNQIPTVKFNIAHDGQNIYLRYDVSEYEIRAVTNANNGPVWEDSCVEFFISFDESGYYYNLEQSCIGTSLLGYRKDRNETTKANDEIINAIFRKSSLGSDTFDMKQGKYDWTLISVIPITTFWASNLKTFEGLTAKANFYKCGDKLIHPHYLSWSPVNIEQPNFHRVDFFKNIIFA